MTTIYALGGIVLMLSITHKKAIVMAQKLVKALSYGIDRLMSVIPDSHNPLPSGNLG